MRFDPEKKSDWGRSVFYSVNPTFRRIFIYLDKLLISFELSSKKSANSSK
jgi:hypothetical protein